MKLLRANIEGFRAFTERVEIDLSSDVTVLVGPNGTGKTSLLDALLWGITGRLKRIGDAQERVLSLYSPAGLARVALTLSDRRGRYSLVRTMLDGQMDLAFGADDRTVEGPAAEVEMVRTLWDSGSSSATALDDLYEVMTRSVYLQQDLVRQFVDRDSATDRFDAIGRLVGVGRIADFQRKLVNQRKAWATVMTQKEKDLAEADRRLAGVRSDLTRVGRDAKESDAAQRWRDWWSRLADKGLGGRSVPDLSMPNAAHVLEQTLRALQTMRTSLQRKLSILPQMREDLVQSATAAELPASEIKRLREALSNAKATTACLEASLANAQERDAAVLSELAAQRSVTEEMRTLAQLALRHLSRHCPVCEQTIDAKLVEARLNRLVAEGPAKRRDVVGQTPKMVAELERASAAAKKADRDLQEAMDANRTIAARRTLLRSQLADVELETADVTALDDLSASLNGQVADISEAYKSGEALSLAIVRLSEEGKREDLVHQESKAVEIFERARKTYHDYKTTHEEATRIIDAVRAVADDAVNKQIERIGPLLQKIYTRIDPHPTFRIAKLRSHISYGKGHVDTPVTDPRGGNLEVDSPAEIFSSSQSSALAVSIFLAMNLAGNGLPLHTAILDDPLQSLDSINVLGLLDVLRRTRARRQLLVSTHDENFASLLMRKFRPLEAGQRTSLVRLRNWERTGVSLEQSVDEEIPARLQVVS